MDISEEGEMGRTGYLRVGECENWRAGDRESGRKAKIRGILNFDSNHNVLVFKN